MSTLLSPGTYHVRLTVEADMTIESSDMYTERDLVTEVRTQRTGEVTDFSVERTEANEEASA